MSVRLFGAVREMLRFRGSETVLAEERNLRKLFLGAYSANLLLIGPRILVRVDISVALAVQLNLQYVAWKWYGFVPNFANF